jgi:hypothetical protein
VNDRENNKVSNQIIISLLNSFKDYNKNLKARIKTDSMYLYLNDNANKAFFNLVNLSNNRYKAIKSGINIKTILTKQKKNYSLLNNKFHHDIFFGSPCLMTEKKKLEKSVNAFKTKEINSLRGKLISSLRGANYYDRVMKEKYKKIIEKRKHLIQKGFNFKEINLNFNIEKENKEMKKDDFLFKKEKNDENIQYILINTNNIKYIPEYEPWDKELLNIILSDNNNNINNYLSISEEDLNNIIINKISNNDPKLLDLISYNQHPTPQSNFAKDKEDSTNLQFVLTKKEKNSLKKIYHEQKRKDKQEKIKLGLIKPKETKLKYSNMIQ